ncbi:MAG TPA: isochorismatase family protein [Steroidobacteraceae bacterium]|nr:isochorismatase family protein [Steroidobacteraceae bacterium]
MATEALIVVDVQKDFLPGGALGIDGGDAVVPVLNGAIAACMRSARPIFATRDWHPANHCSFRSRGGPWPAHCVAGSVGAEFAASLALPRDVVVISKATQPDVDAYSGFEGTDLAARLRRCGCTRVLIGGLATDYCVRATALDALREGFAVTVLVDAVRAVDVRPGDGARALAELAALGVSVVSSAAACR